MSSEDEVRRLAVELRILEGTAESLQSRINFLNAAFAELSFAKKTLEGLEKEEKESPLFVPVGGGSYIKAKLADADKVVYGVGAGVTIEKTLKEATEGVSNRISELEKTMRSLEQQLTQVLRKIQGDQTQLQELTAELRRRERR
ncbi:MAG: prefoldin subunit alpha [Candidatus Bathyarchaeota archaeon]|nr:prefoldin subunit alpha [Candidatus Bathyarchaeota archaeon]